VFVALNFNAVPWAVVKVAFFKRETSKVSLVFEIGELQCAKARQIKTT
jgi:hypothetical protein